MDASEPSVDLFWNALTGYQRTAVIKAGIELDVFSRIAAGLTTVDALAPACGAAPRGLRALLNHLMVDGFLSRQGEEYALTATSALFLDRASVAYLGSAVTFLTAPHLMEGFARLTDAVRQGGTAMRDDGTLAPEHPVWIEFARAMAPLAHLTAMRIADLLAIDAAPPGKVLDVSASHGMYGLALARANSGMQITALDWPNVLTVAEETAVKLGVRDRLHLLPGSAFDVPFGSDYAVILLPNFLHHFDPPTCERLLTKCRAALAPGGRVVVVEFIPDDDRMGPPDAVRFATVMLSSVPAGDAWTFAEYQSMFRNAGFSAPTLHELPPMPARVVIASV